MKAKRAMPGHGAAGTNVQTSHTSAYKYHMHSKRKKNVNSRFFSKHFLANKQMRMLLGYSCCLVHFADYIHSNTQSWAIFLSRIIWLRWPTNTLTFSNNNHTSNCNHFTSNRFGSLQLSSICFAHPVHVTLIWAACITFKARWRNQIWWFYKTQKKNHNKS